MSEQQKRTVIIDALRIAAQQYDDIANSVHDSGLVDQYRKQARQARVVAQEMEHA